MKRVGKDIQRLIRDMGGDSDAARINMRTMQVRERYKKAIESVYPEKTAVLHLNHTNSVIIKKIDSKNTLIVYVDDSLFAAELNAQRELIRLRLLELFGEEVDDFQIKVSHWKKYRENHPYVEEESLDYNSKSASIPLTDEEQSYVSRTVAVIEDEMLRKSFERAMTADLEWKKGEKVETDSKNAK